MKKLLVITALVMFVGITFGQELKKGAVLAIRNSTSMVLKPDVTMNQYLDVLMNKWAPEMEKLFPGTKMFMLKGDRGELANGYAWVWYFESEKLRGKYFGTEGNMTDPVLREKMMKLMEILNKYAVDTGMKNYTDWIVL